MQKAKKLWFRQLRQKSSQESISTEKAGCGGTDRRIIVQAGSGKK
jgi:hypothetical protein